ncbi:hypothetical protein [Acetonema longum]|uniref:Uncharacterized protein n=1 Tax=Acetonema longum DSM 6540 TaxID=1009370 RepID=F7NPV6_9FIRM|nr:hypothetical protein [Acetonema longum]EGO61947.1 hypothetical protein ALO_20767 [Acetonema longum DSM 6540]
MSTVIATFYNFGISPAAGRVRLISSSGSTPAVVSGSGANLATTDPIAFYFNGGSSIGTRVLIVERRYDSSFVQIFCYLSVYDPSNWTQTVAPNLTTPYQYSDNTDLLNIYSINSPDGANAGTLFGADYSAGRVFKLVHGVSGAAETLTLASDYYQLTATGSGASAYSVDTVFNTESSVDYIYAVAQQYAVSPPGSSDPSDYTYFNSIIVKLSASNLASVVDGPDATLAPNVFELQLYGGNLYAAALGGPQWNSTPIVWNQASRIQRVTPANLAVTNLVRPANSSETTANDDKFDIRSLAILSDGTAYILTGSYNGSFAFSGRLWVAEIGDLTGDALLSNVAQLLTNNANISNVFGYLWALLPADDISKVWGMLGDNLGIYDVDGIASGTSAVSAGTASEWGAAGSPTFNAIALAMPAITRRLKAGTAPASIKSVRGFVHPLLVSRAGVKPEDFEAFVKAYTAKKY